MSESEPPPVEGEVLRWCEEPVSGSGRYYWHILVNDGSHFVKWQSPTEPDGWEVAVHSRDEAILRLTSALADRDREVAALRGGQRREPASDEYVNSWDSSDPAEKWSDAHAYHAGFQAGFRTAEHYHGIADGPYMGPTPAGTPASTGAAHEVCPGCGQEIDPETCGCGEPIQGHSNQLHVGHSPVPMGCDCLRMPAGDRAHEEGANADR